MRMPRPNGRLRIIIANEPRSYRDALAGVIKQARPRDGVMNVDPRQLEQVLRRSPGALVVCSEVSPAVQRLAGAWVRLGAHGEVEISTAAGVEAVARQGGLDAVLDAVDAAGTRLAHLR